MAEEKVIKYAELSADCEISVTEALRRYFSGQSTPAAEKQPDDNSQRRKEDDTDH